MFAVNGGVADTEIISQATEKKARESSFAEVSGQAGGCAVVIFEEGGVAVDGLAESFAEDEFGVGDFERGMEGSAFRVLEAVFGPEGLDYCLRAVGDFYGFVGMLAMRTGEGDVSGGVPVLGEDDVIEFAGEDIDDWDDPVAFGYSERASDSVNGGAKIFLYVDDEEGVSGSALHLGLMVVQKDVNWT
jgi:hypothetical protein